MVAVLPRLDLLRAGVVVDEGFGSAAFAGLVMHIPRRHRVVAAATGQDALQGINAVALSPAETARAPLSIGGRARFFLADALRQFKQRDRDERRIIRRDDVHPGLNQVRWMVCNEEIDGLLCTWYDRLTRSRGFYVLDEEFHRHNVRFVTLHDLADTRTASGRFMESMLVAAKTYEREQTSEKVRTKMRQRQEKGLHQGGLVPVGFSCQRKQSF